MRLIVASLLFTLTLAAQDDAIQRLEAAVAKDPTNMTATAELLQRYAGLVDNPGAIESKRRHVLRLIEHTPDTRALAALPATIDPKVDPEGYSEAARLWRRQLAKSDASAKTVANAALFFRITERSTAIATVEAASKAHPGDPDLARMRGILDAVTLANTDPTSPESQKARQDLDATTDSRVLAAAGESFMNAPVRGTGDPFALAEQWAKRAGATDLLITIYLREANASLDPREKARYQSQALQAATTDGQRLRVLADLANTEFVAADNAAAERHSRQLLDLATANPKLGNHDELIHAGHTVLGRVALDRGDKKEATEELLASARVKRVNVPRMTLAQDLLDAGERDAVLQYLELCRAILNNDQGRIDHYVKVVKAPGTPDLLAPFVPPGRTPPPKRTLAAPLTQADAVSWAAVTGAESYVVEWDSRDEKGWASEREGGLVRVIPTRETSVILDFSGERPIRWRVYAVSSRNGAGKTSEWHEIQNPLRALPERAEAEFEAGDMASAERDALQILQMAGARTNEWNHGDLAHAANTLLGRLALRHGELEEAKQRLAASGKIEGSPVLGSFGPSMKLAQELLAAGERDAVVQYLEACRIIWKSDRGRLDRLIDLAQHEAAPNLLLPYVDPGRSLVGAKAPRFKLRDLTGKEWTFDELSGMTIILDFWTTWCLPCLEQFHVLDGLTKELQARDVVLFAVDVGEDERTVRSFLKKNQVGFPVLLAGDDAMILSYRVAVYPTLTVIDRSGYIREYHTGSVTAAELAGTLPR